MAEYSSDLNDRKRLEAELRSSREALFNIVGRSDSGILIVDNDGIIQFTNPSAEKLFNKKQKDLIGNDFGFPIESENKEEIDIWRGDQCPGTGEMSSIKTEWEGEKANLIMIRDITDLKQKESDLRQLSIELQERNEDLEAYAHTVAHDLKSPVSAITSFSELVYNEIGQLPESKIKKFSYHILKSSKSLSNIIEELLLFASLQKTDIKIVELNMNDIVVSAIERLIHMKEKSEAVIKLPDQWLSAVGHAPWVEEVWKNYLSNAFKYGGVPPVIEIGCDPIGSRFNPETIKYWIKDHGPGISEKNQKRLFNKFERLDQVTANGYGLGLSIVRRIIEKLGGTVGVESEPGKGTTFFFTLPHICNSTTTSTKDKESKHTLPTFYLAEKTLIVEDDMASDLYIGMISKKFSKEILHVNNGNDAVRICRENPDIDLVLMDIGLPGIDGFEATRKIREFNKNVIIIAQTALTMSNDREQAMEAGCNAYISKPINLNELIDIIEEQVKLEH